MSLEFNHWVREQKRSRCCHPGEIWQRIIVALTSKPGKSECRNSSISQAKGRTLYVCSSGRAQGSLLMKGCKPENLRVEAEFEPLSLASSQKLGKTEIAAKGKEDASVDATVTCT